MLLDLTTGRHRLVDAGTNWVSEVRWLSDSRAYVVSNGSPGPTQHVTVPDLEITELPYRLWQVGISPDDRVFSLRRIRVGEAELIEHIPQTEPVPLGRLTVPGLGRGLDRRWGVAATQGRFAVHHQPRPHHFRWVELLVLDAKTLKVEAMLRFDNRDYTVRSFDWLDPDTMLLTSPDGIVAWRPDTAQMLRVLDVPAAAPHRYWSVDLAGTVHRGVTITSDRSWHRAVPRREQGYVFWQFRTG